MISNDETSKIKDVQEFFNYLIQEYKNKYKTQPVDDITDAVVVDLISLVASKRGVSPRLYLSNLGVIIDKGQKNETLNVLHEILEPAIEIASIESSKFKNSNKVNECKQILNNVVDDEVEYKLARVIFDILN